MRKQKVLRKVKKEVRELYRLLGELGATVGYVGDREVEEMLLWNLDSLYKALDKLNKALEEFEKELDKKHGNVL